MSDRGAAGCHDVPWLAFVNEAEITATEALGYLTLGEPAYAERLFCAALAGGLPPRNRALYTAQLATTVLAQGRLDEAITIGSAVLGALEGGISSVRVLETLRPVYDAAKKEANKRHRASNRTETNPQDEREVVNESEDPPGCARHRPSTARSARDARPGQEESSTKSSAGASRR